MIGIQAHFNGGPMDDQYMVVERRSLVVSKQPKYQMGVDLGFITEPLVTGHYRAREVLGELVPHDLSGTYEFDWQGWSP